MDDKLRGKCLGQVLAFRNAQVLLDKALTSFWNRASSFVVFDGGGGELCFDTLVQNLTQVTVNAVTWDSHNVPTLSLLKALRGNFPSVEESVFLFYISAFIYSV